jgi:uncharacterized protein involved in outer membrane biogenesis
VWNLRRKVAWLVLLPLAILAALILSLPLILNSADYQALLISQAQDQLGRKVEMKRAHVEVFPYVRMTLDDVVIREADGQDEFLATAHLFIDLRIFPLLKRKVVAKRIALDMPKVTIKRGPDGKLNISDLFTATADTTTFTTPLLGEELSIADGEIVFEDTYGSARPRTLAFRHVNTTVKRTGMHLGYRFFAALPQETGDSTITVTGEVARQAIEQVGAGGRATGRVEAKQVSLAWLASFLNDNVFLRGVQTPVDLAASYEYRWATGERALEIKDLTATDGGTTIAGTIGLARLFTPRMQFTASVTTTPFKLESLVASLPEEVIQSHSLGFLKEAQMAGSVQLVSLQVGWMPEQERRLTVQGEVDLSGGSAVVGVHRVPLSDVKGKLRVSADRIAIEQLTGRYGLAEVTEGRGEVTSLAQNPTLSLDIKGKVSAQELAVIVARFAPKALLPAGPAGLTGLKGEADAVVKLAGPLAKLDHLEVEWGLTVRDIGFTDQRLSLPFADLGGGVHSIRRGVAFERLGGRIGKSSVALNGEIAVQSDENAHYVLKVSGQADAKEALGVFLRDETKALVADGFAGFGFSVSGRTGELHSNGRVDMRQAGITHSVGIRKPIGMPGAVEFDLLWNPGRSLKVRRLMAEIPPFRVHTKGLLTLSTPGRFELDVKVPPFSLRALPKGLLASKTAPVTGTLQTSFVATGPLGNWRAVKLNGQAEIKHLRLKLDGLRAPIEDLTLHATFVDDRIVINRGTLKIAESRIIATGDIRGWRGVPRIQAAVEAPNLDLALLIPQGERSPVRTAMEAISGTAKLAATASVPHGRYRGILFDEFQATVTGADGVLVVDPITGRVGTGTIAGQVRIALPKGKPASVETSLNLKGIAVEPVFQSFGMKEPPFTGVLKLDGAISGNGTNPRGTAPTLNGDVRGMVEKGYFQKLSATAKIIRLLGLPRVLAGEAEVSEKGMPFDCMSGHIVVKNGIAEVQDYLLHSEIMKITAAGMYDIPNDNYYDMTMVVTPFGSRETLLQSIPLFGKLFAGEREGFSTAFFEIKGPMTDPKVTWIPSKSLESGITGTAKLAFDLMKNVVMLPKELIAPSDKAPKSPCSSQ